jgi:GNAT superfamily N-acetyltransferase
MLKKNLLKSLFHVKADGYELKEAGESELRYIGSQPESLDYAVYKNRHSDDHICFCAKSDNEVMCYIWISPKIIGLFFGTDKQIEIAYLEPNQAYSYDLYTYNKYRHKGIASQLQNFTNLSLKERGITERFNIIGPSFIGSMKISLRSGFEPHRMVYVYGINKYRKAFLGTTRKSNKLREWKELFVKTYGVKKTK